jgi:GTP pyrophosphokinase
VSVIDRHEDDTILNFLLQVKDRIHLARIMRNIKKMPNVLRVLRDSA